MPKSKFRGNEVEEINGEWFFVESGELISETWQCFPCGYCGMGNTKEGHDGCLGTLKGVMNACCGHGQTGAAYIQFLDGTVIDGNSALEHFIKEKQ